jgi:hypothetical protein
MKGRPAFGGAALAGAAVLATLGLASGSDGPDLTPVPSAQPRAAGDAPAHQLPRSCASASSRRARCRDPRGIIGWYGHENDAPSPDDPVRPLTGSGGGRHDRGSEDRARQEHVPGCSRGRRAPTRTTTTAPTSCSRA